MCDLLAQDSYTLASKVEGMYMTSKDFKALNEPETFTVSLNAGKHYKLALEGTQVEFSYEGTTFGGDFKTIDIYPSRNITVIVTVRPTSKKNKASLVVTYLGKATE
jgi:hypothetical protein